MEILPAYHYCHREKCMRLVDTLARPKTKRELIKDFNYEFLQGMYIHQKARSLDWIQATFRRTLLKQKEVASELRMSNPKVSRLFGDTVNHPFSTVQLFYVAFGADDASDHPFKTRDILNLGGYRNAVKYLNNLLRVQRSNPESQLSTKDLNIEELYCLNMFYSDSRSNPATFPSSSKIFDDIAETVLSGVPEEIKPSHRTIVNKYDLSQVLAGWGNAWLACLTMIADVQGIGKVKVGEDQEKRVVVSRPIRVFEGTP